MEQKKEPKEDKGIAALRDVAAKATAPVPVALVVFVEHRECGTRFPRDGSCPKCKKMLLED